MALTIKPITRNGRLVVYDDMGNIVAHGQATPSKSEPGYITLTMHFNTSTQVNRVPISWFLALRDLPDPEHDPELR